MSSVDERIIQIKMENNQFEQEAKNTMNTLKSLASAFSSFGSSISKIPQASFSFLTNSTKGAEKALGDFNQSVESSVKSFDKLGLASALTFTNIVNAAENAAAKVAKALTFDQISSGLTEYEMKLDTIQVILANTQGANTLEEVKDRLEELNRYADKTIYNFGQMTQNIGRFTAAGVNLDDSVTAIKGLSNLSALVGANSEQNSRAMYNLSQALSVGKMQLLDWRSFENAGGLGGKVFRDELIKTADELGKFGKAWSTAGGETIEGAALMRQAMGEDGGAFRETLKYGWVDNDVMITTLQKFADETSELGQKAYDAATKVRTFTKLMDTLKESVQSGWAETWEIIIGDYEDAPNMWTKVNEVIGGYLENQAHFRNVYLKEWADQGGRQKIINGLTNAYEALTTILGKFSEAFWSSFSLSRVEMLMKMSESFETFTANVKNFVTAGENLSKPLDEFYNAINRLKISTGEYSEEYKAVYDRVMNDDFKFGNVNAYERYLDQYTEKTKDAYAKAVKTWNESFDGIIRDDSGFMTHSIDKAMFGYDSIEGGIKIAFTPQMVTENGEAVLLEKGTVTDYINNLIQIATDENGNVDKVKLLDLDARGLEIYGTKVKNLIAGIGDEADSTYSMILTMTESGILHNLSKIQNSGIFALADPINKTTAAQRKANKANLEAQKIMKKNIEYIEKNNEKLGKTGETAENVASKYKASMGKVLLERGFTPADIREKWGYGTGNGIFNESIKISTKEMEDLDNAIQKVGKSSKAVVNRDALNGIFALNDNPAKRVMLLHKEEMDAQKKADKESKHEIPEDSFTARLRNATSFASKAGVIFADLMSIIQDGFNLFGKVKDIMVRVLDAAVGGISDAFSYDEVSNNLHWFMNTAHQVVDFVKNFVNVNENYDKIRQAVAGFGSFYNILLKFKIEKWKMIFTIAKWLVENVLPPLVDLFYKVGKALNEISAKIGQENLFERFHAALENFLNSGLVQGFISLLIAAFGIIGDIVEIAGNGVEHLIDIISNAGDAASGFAAAFSALDIPGKAYKVFSSVGGFISEIAENIGVAIQDADFSFGAIWESIISHIFGQETLGDELNEKEKDTNKAVDGAVGNIIEIFKSIPDRIAKAIDEAFHFDDGRVQEFVKNVKQQVSQIPYYFGKAIGLLGEEDETFDIQSMISGDGELIQVAVDKLDGHILSLEELAEQKSGALKTIFKNVKEAISNFPQFILEQIAKIDDDELRVKLFRVYHTIRSTIEGIQNTFVTIGKVISSYGPTILNYIGQLIRVFAGLISSDSATKLGESLGKAFTVIGDLLVRLMNSNILRLLGDILYGIVTIVTNVISSDVFQRAVDILDWFAGGVSRVLEAIGSLDFSNIGGSISELFNWVKNEVVGFTQGDFDIDFTWLIGEDGTFNIATAVGGAIEKVENFFKGITWEDVWNQFNPFHVDEAKADVLDGAENAVGEASADSGNKQKLTDRIITFFQESLGKPIVDFFSNIGEIISGFIAIVTGRVDDVSKFFDEKLSDPLGKISETIGGFVDNLFDEEGNFTRQANSFFNGVKTLFGLRLMNSITGTFKSLKGLNKGITSLFKSMKKSTIIGDFFKSWSGKDFLDSLKMNGPITAIKEVIESFKKQPSGVNLESFAEPLRKGLKSGLTNLLKPLKVFKRGVNSLLKNIGKGTKSFLTNFGKGMKAAMVGYKWDKIGSGILKFAAAIGILAVSLAGLSLIPVENLNKVLGFMAKLAVGALAFVLALRVILKGTKIFSTVGEASKGGLFGDFFNSLFGRDKGSVQFRTVAVGILAIAAAIAVLVYAIKSLGDIGLSAVVPTILMVGMIEALGDMLGSMGDKRGMLSAGIGILFMAYAMNELVKPIDALSQLGFLRGVGGTAAVSVLMLISSLAGRLVSGTRGLIKAAIAMNIMGYGLKNMIVPVTTLGKLNMPDVWKGIFALSGIVGSLSLLTAISNRIGGLRGFIGFSVGLVILSAAVGNLGKTVKSFAELASANMYSFGAAVTALLVIPTVLGTLAAIMKNNHVGFLQMFGLAAGIAALSAAFMSLRITMGFMASMNLGKFIEAMTVLVGIPILLVTAVTVLNGVHNGFLKLFGVSAGIVVFAVAINFLADTLYYISGIAQAIEPAISTLMSMAVVFASFTAITYFLQFIGPGAVGTLLTFAGALAVLAVSIAALAAAINFLRTGNPLKGGGIFGGVEVSAAELEESSQIAGEGIVDNMNVSKGLAKDARTNAQAYYRGTRNNSRYYDKSSDIIDDYLAPENFDYADEYTDVAGEWLDPLSEAASAYGDVFYSDMNNNLGYFGSAIEDYDMSGYMNDLMSDVSDMFGAGSFNNMFDGAADGMVQQLFAPWGDSVQQTIPTIEQQTLDQLSEMELAEMGITVQVNEDGSRTYFDKNGQVITNGLNENLEAIMSPTSFPGLFSGGFGLGSLLGNGFLGGFLQTVTSEGGIPAAITKALDPEKYQKLLEEKGSVDFSDMLQTLGWTLSPKNVKRNEATGTGENIITETMDKAANVAQDVIDGFLGKKNPFKFDTFLLPEGEKGGLFGLKSNFVLKEGSTEDDVANWVIDKFQKDWMTDEQLSKIEQLARDAYQNGGDIVGIVKDYYSRLFAVREIVGKTMHRNTGMLTNNWTDEQRDALYNELLELFNNGWVTEDLEQRAREVEIEINKQIWITREVQKLRKKVLAGVDTSNWTDDDFAELEALMRAQIENGDNVFDNAHKFAIDRTVQINKIQNELTAAQAADAIDLSAVYRGWNEEETSVMKAFAEKRASEGASLEEILNEIRLSDPVKIMNDLLSDGSVSEEHQAAAVELSNSIEEIAKDSSLSEIQSLIEGTALYRGWDETDQALIMTFAQRKLEAGESMEQVIEDIRTCDPVSILKQLLDEGGIEPENAAVVDALAKQIIDKEKGGIEDLIKALLSMQDPNSGESPFAALVGTIAEGLALNVEAGAGETTGKVDQAVDVVMTEVEQIPEKISGRADQAIEQAKATVEAKTKELAEASKFDVSNIQSAVTATGEEAAPVYDSLMQQVSNEIPSVGTQAGASLTDAVNTSVESNASITGPAAGSKMTDHILSGSKTMAETEGPNVGNKITDTVTGNVNSEENIAKSKTAGNGITSNIFAGVTEIANRDGEGVASNALAGLLNYFSRADVQTIIKNTGRNIGVTLLNGTTEALDEHSPSKEFEWVASMAVLGLINQVNSELSVIRSAGAQMGDSLFSSFQEAADAVTYSMNNDITPVISPVVDMTQIQNGVHMIDGEFNRGSVQLATQANYSFDNMKASLFDDRKPITPINYREDLYSLHNDIAGLNQTIASLNLVLDSGQLVGGLRSQMNASLGATAARRIRGL